MKLDDSIIDQFNLEPEDDREPVNVMKVPELSAPGWILPCIRRDGIRTEKGMRRSVRDRTLSSAHLAAFLE